MPATVRTQAKQAIAVLQIDDEDDGGEDHFYHAQNGIAAATLPAGYKI